MSPATSPICVLISPKFWLSELEQKLLEKGEKARLLALYLVTNSYINTKACYRLSFAVIAEETGLSRDGIGTLMRQLIDLGFCSYNETTQTVQILERGFWKIEGAA